MILFQIKNFSFQIKCEVSNQVSPISESEEESSLHMTEDLRMLLTADNFDDTERSVTIFTTYIFLTLL